MDTSNNSTGATLGVKKMLTPEQMLSKQKLRVERVDLSEGYVYVRELYGNERDAFEGSLMEEDPETGIRRTSVENFRAKFAVSVLCNEKGENMFTDAQAEQLGDSMGVYDLEKIINVAQRLNSMSQEDRRKLEKKLEKTRK